MSKRKRHSAKPVQTHQIEWLNHRTGYPSPAERKAIIRLRRKISAEFIALLIAKANPEDPRSRAMYKKYGREEVQYVIKTIDKAMEFPSLIADDAHSYREYRHRYARFGAGLKFFTSKEIDNLYINHTAQLKQEDENEAEKLLLLGWRNWEDITPPAIPPRPADYAAPQPASYSAPINELLEWGDDLKRSQDFADEAKLIQWKKHIPALTRMALDQGLLNGWPSETSSWAPWHAIHALGNLQAWESAPALAQIANLENDWLSDHLPHIWAEMGMEVEPTLWMILENTSASTKQRGLAAEGLYMMIKENEAIKTKAIKGFDSLLQNAKTFDPVLNAHLIRFIQEMDAVDKLRETIDAAFEQNRVDEDIFSPEDLEMDLDDNFDDNLGEDNTD